MAGTGVMTDTGLHYTAISIFFLGRAMAGTGVMTDTGLHYIQPISIFFLGGTMAGTGVLALARAMVDTGILPSPSFTWVGPWLALESLL